MLATIVKQSADTAQFFFLVAAIAAGLAIVIGIIERAWPYWPVVGAIVIFCLSLGLLFLA